MKATILALLLSCSIITAQENQERKEVFKLTKQLVQLYQAKNYTYIDSLNQRREKLFTEAIKQGYGKEGLELVAEWDYNIARIIEASNSPDSPMILRLKGVRDSIALQHEY